MDTNFLKNKYIFVDFDGTLCEYRYFGHLSGKSVDPSGKSYGGLSLNELLFETYQDVRPLKTMQKVLSQIHPDKIFVLGAIVTFNEIKTKIEWLRKHYPFIKEDNLIFVADLNIKTEVLKEYSKRFGIPFKEIVFIDDKLETLRDAEEQGFSAYHITTFVE